MASWKMKAKLLARSRSPAFRANSISGELHGNKDFALLEYLSRWFDVGMRKKLSSRLFNFQAVAKPSGDGLDVH